MEIDPNLLIAAKMIHDECGIRCADCQLKNICDGEYPCGWEIPDPPPEPTERPRIEWLRMLPDDEMLLAFDNIGFHSMSWWHEVVGLEKFRNYVGLI